MRVCVLTDYRIQGEFIIGIMPVSFTYEASMKDKIYSAFEKIKDEKSLIKFAKKYGLPAMDWEGVKQEDVKKATEGIDGFTYKHNVIGAWCRTWDPIEDVLYEAYIMNQTHHVVSQDHKIPVIDLNKSLHSDNEMIMRLAEDLKRQYIISYEESSTQENILYNRNRVAGILTDRMRGIRVVAKWADDRRAFRWGFQYDTLVSLIWEKFALDVISGAKRMKICPICLSIHHRNGVYCSDQCKMRRDNVERNKKG